MKFRLTVYLCAVAALFSSCSSSRKGSSLANSANIVNDVQEFDVEGVHVLLRQSVSVPVVTAVLFVKGGSTVSSDDEPVATEYFAMKVIPASGSQRIGKPYFRRKLIRMGSSISGDEGRDYSAISMECTRENFDTTWAYFTNCMTQPTIDKVEYDNFKKSVLLGINSRANEADGYSNYLLDSSYFYGHPYGKNFSDADVKRVTADIAMKHFRTVMVRSRFLLSVVGNVSRDELTDKIEASLGKLPEGSYTPAAIKPPEKAFKPSAFFPPFGRKLPTDYLIGYYLTPSKGDPDYYAYLRLRNFFGGFVFNHIRVQRNLAYAPNVDDKDGITSVGVISLQTAYIDSAVKVIYDDVDFFQQNSIRESAIRSGVAGWATRNYLKAETTSSQAALLGQAKLATGDWHDAFFSYEKLSRVTPEELKNAAIKYLRNFNWLVLGDTTHVSRKLLESR